MRMKKISGSEFDESKQHEPYGRMCFRLDLKMLTVVILTLVVLTAAQSSPFDHNNNDTMSINAKQQQQNTSVPGKISNEEHPEMAKRLNLIMNMTREVWKQQITSSSPAPEGLDMIQMLSTFWVMGLRAEYEEGKSWIMANYSDPDFYYVATFVVATEYMGSLLSSYALTNDTIWLDRAKQIGDKLKFEFDTPTGLPKQFILLRPQQNQSFAGSKIDLIDVVGQYLEFAYLADMTNDLDMKVKVHKARTFLRNGTKPKDSLYIHLIDVVTGEWTSKIWSFFWPASAFYQYLIKSYVQSGGQDEQAIEMYRETIDEMLKNSMIQKWSRNNLTNVENDQISASMVYSGCYLGAIFALGANAMQKQLDRSPSTASSVINQQQARIEQQWTLAKAITETCHKHANRFTTKLPRRYYSRNVLTSKDEFTFDIAAAYAESYFVLWRLTRESKYRDYAWELAQAIHKHCRRKDGKYPRYYHLFSVELENSQDTFYSSAKLTSLISTLKYLYLTFSEDSLLPLDQWIFNRAGQPLPVCGKNSAYSAEKYKGQ